MATTTDREIVFIFTYPANLFTQKNSFSEKIQDHTHQLIKKLDTTTGTNTTITEKETLFWLLENKYSLPKTQCIVIDSTLEPKKLQRKALLARRLTDALHMASGEQIFFIGGEKLFTEVATLTTINKILATVVHKDQAADNFFTSIKDPIWRMISQESPIVDEVSKIKVHFKTLINIKNPHLQVF